MEDFNGGDNSESGTALDRKGAGPPPWWIEAMATERATVAEELDAKLTAIYGQHILD